MAISRLSKRKLSLKQSYGPEVGRVRTSATRMRKEKESGDCEVAYSSPLQNLLEKFDRAGLCWKMCRASSAPTTGLHLNQLSTNSKRSGIWGYGLRVTLSARASLKTAKESSLSALIERRFPITSILTAANCLGIIRRERRAGRKLDPIFKESLSRTLRFWFSVAAALGIPKRRAIAPRYVPKLESIKEATLTDQYYVARNLTWNECEKLMGFPEGWTVDGGDSLGTR